MPFGVGAGAVWRIHDADVHVFHAEVAVDGSFGLGKEGRDAKNGNKYSQCKCSFHGLLFYGFFVRESNLLFFNLMHLVVLFDEIDSIKSPCPFPWLAIAKNNAVEPRVPQILLLAQIAEAVFHPALAQLELH